MKNSNYLFVLGFIAMSIFMACKNSDIVSDKTKVTITENDNQLYELTAQYSDYKAKKVKEIVNTTLSPDVIFKSNSGEINAKYTMNDGTSFYLKSTNGTLNIKFERTKNSEASYQKMKRLYSAISDVLAINH
jgi:hypothetical protein